MIVVPGVTIGENTVIGAGSVVTKGNTQLLADTLHNFLPQEDCYYFGIPNPAAMEADTLYVGFWTDKGKADESSSGFLKQPLHLPNLDAMIENFDQALSHPDEEDLERLKRAVK